MKRATSKIRILIITLITLSLILFLTGINKAQVEQTPQSPEPGLEAPQSGTPQFAPGELVVQLKEGKTLADIQDLNTKYNVTSTEEVFPKTPDPKDVLKELKGKLSDLDSQHKKWYWQTDKESKEYKDWMAKIEKEKAELKEKIQGQEELIKHLEERQKRAPEDVTPPKLDNIYTLKTSPQTDILAMAQDYSNNPNIEYAKPNTPLLEGYFSISQLSLS